MAWVSVASDESLRKNILDKLKTALEYIHTDNGGWRTDVNKVEFLARDWAELKKDDANTTDGIYIGIVPIRETCADHPGIIVSNWEIALVCHFRMADKLATTAVDTISDFAVDLRGLLYDPFANTEQTARTQIENVHFYRILSRQDSVGSPEALQEKLITVEYRILVRFEEPSIRTVWSGP